MPEIFFNERCIGGLKELEKLDQDGELDRLIQDTISCDSGVHPLPQYRRPDSKEFLKVCYVHVHTYMYAVIIIYY